MDHAPVYQWVIGQVMVKAQPLAQLEQLDAIYSEIGAECEQWKLPTPLFCLGLHNFFYLLITDSIK